MEEQQQPVSVIENQVPPQPMKGKKSGLKWILIILLLLLVAGIGGFLLTQGQSTDEEITPTPFAETATETPTPTATPKAVDKEKVKIQVQNGTGVSGEAGYLQGVLKGMGYKTVDVGNAETQDASTTTVTYSSTLSSTITDEITEKLKSIYKAVDIKTSSTLKSYDVQIVTGLRKGATAKPSASPTPRSTSSPRPSGSPTASPTATP